MFNSFRQRKLVIVLNSIALFGGATRPLLNYYKHEVNDKQNIDLLYLSNFKGLIKFLLSAFFSPKIVVNGLAGMDSWLVLITCFFRKGIIFYCHEAEYAFNSFRKASPSKFKMLQRVFPKLTVACVSEWQKNYLCSTYNVRSATVVYNNIDLDVNTSLDASRTNIIMLGYIMERKGVDLFSKVADLASVQYPDFKFSWIGSGNADGLYCSEKVDWLGEFLNPSVLLQQCDMLFLSAIDDPFPLACLEAIAFKKKCVVYKNTGTADVIRDLPGCAVFDEYTPEEALKAIVRAVHTPIDAGQYDFIQNNISSVSSFARRFDDLLHQQ